MLFQRGWTPLIMAAKGGYTEVVDYLLDRDPHINATDQVNSPHSSSQKDRVEHLFKNCIHDED